MITPKFQLFILVAVLISGCNPSGPYDFPSEYELEMQYRCNRGDSDACIATQKAGMERGAMRRQSAAQTAASVASIRVQPLEMPPPIGGTATTVNTTCRQDGFGGINCISR